MLVMETTLLFKGFGRSIFDSIRNSFNTISRHHKLHKPEIPQVKCIMKEGEDGGEQEEQEEMYETEMNLFSCFLKKMR
ncbi:hypothetical protein HAX54_006201 [Datura stramonium]|uniref:Uncharacterized protein n=1 Tax=Datura stramonium TaxID=4076 RepID=A0ABS8T9X7_DATST|nr:hypothetical protein [Datura stramonium]